MWARMSTFSGRNSESSENGTGTDDRRHLRPQVERPAPADIEKSVTRQVERGTAYAQSRGRTVDPAHVYVDDAISSAEFVRRPGLAALVAALTPRSPFQVLLMAEQFRLGREQIETAYTLKRIIDADGRVASAAGPDGRILAGRRTQSTATRCRRGPTSVQLLQQIQAQSVSLRLGPPSRADHRKAAWILAIREMERAGVRWPETPASGF
jgi:hypothetical protein